MKTLLIPSSIALLTLGAHGAVISWSDGSDFLATTGHQNISTWGSHAEAYNLSGATQSVNTGAETITFVGSDTVLPGGGFSVATGSTMASTSAEWVSTIHRADWSGDSPHTLNLTGLTIGDLYQIELFTYDNRNASIGARTFQFGDGAGGGTGNQSNVYTNSGGISVIGQFTADAATQSIVLTQSATDPTLNAYSLRTVPEPGSSLLTLLGLAFLARRKR